MSRLSHLYHNDRSTISVVVNRLTGLSKSDAPFLSFQKQTARRYPGKSAFHQQKQSIQYQEQLAENNGGVAAKSPKYEIQEHALGRLSPLRVIIIGAGINGLNILYTLKNQAQNVEGVIYEKNPECGGTWYENR